MVDLSTFPNQYSSLSCQIPETLFCRFHSKFSFILYTLACQTQKIFCFPKWFGLGMLLACKLMFLGQKFFNLGKIFWQTLISMTSMTIIHCRNCLRDLGTAQKIWFLGGGGGSQFHRQPKSLVFSTYSCSMVLNIIRQVSREVCG